MINDTFKRYFKGCGGKNNILDIWTRKLNSKINTTRAESSWILPYKNISILVFIINVSSLPNK
jgi:hypothetical protein